MNDLGMNERFKGGKELGEKGKMAGGTGAHLIQLPYLVSWGKCSHVMPQGAV